MQRSDELVETAAIVFKQLIDLGIAPNRLYIGIITDHSGEVEFWITDEDGTKLWERNYGGTGGETFHVMQEMPDGGYILGGSSSSSPGSCVGSPGVRGSASSPLRASIAGGAVRR